jgi:GMP synthase (glutamine-hydrolysing)
LAGLGQTLPVLHWHGDTFDLPPGAVRLAQSELCRNQAFRIGRTAFGLQFHVEIDAETARAWALADLDFVVAALGPDGPANIAERSEVEARRMEPSGLRLLNNILSQMLDP